MSWCGHGIIHVNANNSIWRIQVLSVVVVMTRVKKGELGGGGSNIICPIFVIIPGLHGIIVNTSYTTMYINNHWIKRKNRWWGNGVPLLKSDGFCGTLQLPKKTKSSTLMYLFSMYYSSTFAQIKWRVIPCVNCRVYWCSPLYAKKCWNVITTSCHRGRRQHQQNGGEVVGVEERQEKKQSQKVCTTWCTT